MEILKLQPCGKDYLWGGTRLRDEYGKKIDLTPLAETWECSVHPDGPSVIANGEFKGQTLAEVLKRHPEYLGSKVKNGELPVLVKFIDAKQDLSVQVHPDDAYAAAHENGSLGKMECWYILDCEPGTTIVIGHNARTWEEMQRMIQEKQWDAFVRQIPIKKGDVFQIDPGCVHAIKGGTLLLETQQSSDITYRVYDYDRLSDGKPRELHIKQSLDVIQVPFDSGAQPTPWVERECSGGRKTLLASCSRYICFKLDINTSWREDFGQEFTNVSILEGEGCVDGTPVAKGQHFIIPADYGECRFEGQLSLIGSQPR